MGMPNYGMSLGNPDFVLDAEAYGAHGHRPATAAELAPTLERCLGATGVHLIDLAIDYSDNDRILNREIKELSAKV